MLILLFILILSTGIFTYNAALVSIDVEDIEKQENEVVEEYENYVENVYNFDEYELEDYDR